MSESVEKLNVVSTPNAGLISSSVRGEMGSPSRTHCPACGCLYLEPRILPCLHTLCSSCIRQLEPVSVPGLRVGDSDSGSEGSWAREQPCPVSLLCPVCDSEVDLPRDGVDGLVVNQLVVSEVFLLSLRSQEVDLVCDLCSEGDAERRCEVCNVNLCDFCCKAHRRQKKTASHGTIALKDLKGSGRILRPVLCSLHPPEELKLFCETCDRPVCRDCVVGDHRDHACDFSSAVIHKYGDYVRELLKRTQPHLGALEEALREIERVSQAVEERVETVADEIKAFACSYVKAIEKHRDRLLKQLREMKNHKENCLHLQRIQLEQLLSDMRTGVDFTEHLLTSGSNLEILVTKEVVINRLKRLNEMRYKIHPGVDDGIWFTPQERAGQCDGFEVQGVILMRAVDPSKSIIQGEVGFHVGRQGRESEFLLVCNDTLGERMGRGGESVRVSIIHKDNNECIITPVVTDNNNGTYQISFIPQEAGIYTVWVCVQGQHVQGSPFSLTVKSKFRKHNGMFHCCTFCSSQGQKDARCGCGGTMPGGYQGCGHGHKGHPGQPHWSCCGKTTENSDCSGSLSANHSRSLLRTVAL
ncbi:E3 ubiquitin-protein ligase TRIM45 [Latimeria chalumnae]|uniref:E3 ubiquitin-protein ligase TRIM45 n=1 Tax=Latimeria chalumnae TaxID=7897 RepID=UPI0003C1A98B|nr:PREDICTED: tripartite motif-containing protein 45 isoform X1 [Latimeria chalumnae]|eukprot:XP_005993667.1 PREDICTED: tripartite motif-containing protein 45 isoform X1 [Latimeria chalumnae]